VRSFGPKLLEAENCKGLDPKLRLRTVKVPKACIFFYFNFRYEVKLQSLYRKDKGVFGKLKQNTSPLGPLPSGAQTVHYSVM
jgi:hypothetical protein